MPYPVPCSSSEKQALLRLILSDFSPFKIPVYSADTPIVYGPVVDAIHSNIIDYVTNGVSIFANANGDPVKTATGLDSVRSRLTHIFYQQHYYYYLYAKQCKANLIIKCNEYLGNISPRKKYNLLFSLLDLVCTSSISTLQSLAILLAKIYCGRNFMKHTSITGNNATIIISTNSEFIRNLLFHIIKGISTLSHGPLSRMINAFDYAQSVVTEHSVNDLSSASNIIKLINDKLCGNIVNIDTTKQNTVPQQAKDIIIGKTVKIDDEVVGKITYRSNAHFIFLRQTEDKKLLEELKDISDVIDLSDSPLDQYIYDDAHCLDVYEIFFFVFGLVKHGIDLILDETSKVTIPTQELDVQEFANKYLEFSATQEETSTDSSLLNETEPTVSQKGRKKDPTPFIHVDILFSHYLDFQKLSGKRPCTRSAFNSQIMKLFPNVNQKKKNTILGNGERKDAMAFIGLKFNEALFAEDLKKLQDNPQPSENTKEEFISYVEKIVNDYHQFASYELENISPKTNQ